MKLCGIKAAGMERIAAEYPPSSLYYAVCRPVFLNDLYCILRTGGMESAARDVQGRYEPLVDAYQCNEHSFYHLYEPRALAIS